MVACRLKDCMPVLVTLLVVLAVSAFSDYGFNVAFDSLLAAVVAPALLCCILFGIAKDVAPSAAAIYEAISAAIA